MRLFLTVSMLVVLLAGSLALPRIAAHASTQDGLPVLFPETGHTLAYTFRQFYDTQGGLAIFGLPLTEVYLEEGLPVQYFERVRLEWHATLALVQVGHLGREAAQSRAHLPAFLPLEHAPAQPPETAFFPETGHSLRGDFLRFWRKHGGVSIFGYPLSEEMTEPDPADATATYTVQYFERARFEFHPANPPGQRVVLGHLGREYLATHPAPDRATRPVDSAAQAWDNLRPTRLRIPRVGVNTEITETGFSYQAWDVPRHTAGHFWPVSAFPGTMGNIVIAGHVGYHDTIFNKLPDAQVGDELYVTANGEEHRYQVREILLLEPRDTWVMNPTPVETLTLITCVPIDVYSHRLVVRAEHVP